MLFLSINTVSKISFLFALFRSLSHSSNSFFQLICNNDDATQIYVIEVIYWQFKTSFQKCKYVGKSFFGQIQGDLGLFDSIYQYEIYGASKIIYGHVKWKRMKWKKLLLFSALENSHCFVQVDCFPPKQIYAFQIRHLHEGIQFEPIQISIEQKCYFLAQ